MRVVFYLAILFTWRPLLEGVAVDIVERLARFQKVTSLSPREHIQQGVQEMCRGG